MKIKGPRGRPKKLLHVEPALAQRLIAEYQAGRHAWEISPLAGVSAKTLLTWLHEQRVLVRPPGGQYNRKGRELTADEVRLVKAGRLKCRALARRLGCGRTEAHTRMIEAGVSRRPRKRKKKLKTGEPV